MKNQISAFDITAQFSGGHSMFGDSKRCAFNVLNPRISSMIGSDQENHFAATSKSLLASLLKLLTAKRVHLIAQLIRSRLARIQGIELSL